MHVFFLVSDRRPLRVRAAQEKSNQERLGGMQEERKVRHLPNLFTPKQKKAF
jgi:hypothetical protein